MLPKAVREAGEKADAIQNQLKGNTDEQNAPAPEVKAEEAKAPAEEVKPAEAAPNQEQAPAPQTDSWEHKYRVLANKYSAEVPRLAQELRELKEKLREAEAKQTQAPAAEIPSGLTPEKVVEQYGEDFAAAVGAVAARMTEQHIGKLREEFAPKVDAAISHAAANARQSFMQQLTAAVPDWQVIDQEDGFTTFLDEIDDLSGRPRREFFTEADRNNDAARIIRFFTAYRESVAPKKPAQREFAKNAVEYAMSPSSVRSTEVPAGKKVWTQAEVRKFYNDARRGIYSSQDYERIESDIFAAQTEGRFLAA